METRTLKAIVNSNFNYNYREADNTHMIDEDGIDWRNSGVYGDPSSIPDFEWDTGVLIEFSIYTHDFEEGSAMRRLTRNVDEQKGLVQELIDLDELFDDYDVAMVGNKVKQPDWGFLFGYYSQELLVESLRKQGWNLDLCFKPEYNWAELFFTKKIKGA
jgi:hypothetical protein